MATPNARRVVFGTATTARIEAATTDMRVTREDGSTIGNYDSDKVILDTTIGKRFGGKGTATINANQAYNGWVSFFSPVDEDIEGIDTDWEDEYRVWDEIEEITATDHTLRSDSVTCNFLYVKNLGAVEARLALAPKLGAESEGDQFDILIPPGASVSLRLNSVSSGNVKVDTASSSTTIEWVLAKE